jgi:hypothetical protein
VTSRVERFDWSAWPQETGNEADLLHALPAGSLTVEQVRQLRIKRPD